MLEVTKIYAFMTGHLQVMQAAIIRIKSKKLVLIFRIMLLPEQRREVVRISSKMPNFKSVKSKMTLMKQILEISSNLSY